MLGSVLRYLARSGLWQAKCQPTHNLSQPKVPGPARASYPTRRRTAHWHPLGNFQTPRTVLQHSGCSQCSESVPHRDTGTQRSGAPLPSSTSEGRLGSEFKRVRVYDGTTAIHPGAASHTSPGYCARTPCLFALVVTGTY